MFNQQSMGMTPDAETIDQRIKKTFIAVLTKFFNQHNFYIDYN